MKRYVGILLMVIVFGCAKTGDEDWRTFYEKSNYLETPRYEETLRYLDRLEKASRWIKVTYFGVSPEGRKMPLVIVDKSGKFTPESARSQNKVILLVQAGIHAGEIDGKDAMLMLLRNMAIGQQHTELLDHVTILFMPFFNVDGHERASAYNRFNQNGPKEMGWRVTSQNLNLNRDYVKADAPEMRDWLKVFNQWLPDLFIDCHVTDGADYRHAITYGIDVSQNVAEPVRAWTRETYLPYMNKAMADSGFPLVPYVYLIDNKNITSGIIGGSASPRFSTGYCAIQNRVGLLIETHMFKDYKTRVTGTYQMILHTLELLNKEAETLRKVNRDADEETATSLVGKKLPVSFALTQQFDLIDFMGFNYRVVPSEVSGDPKMIVWENVPIDYKIPYFNYVKDSDVVDIPYAYIVPKQWTNLIDVLAAQGIVMERLSENKKLAVTLYRFSNVKWAEKPFEGRITLDCDVIPIPDTLEFKEGDYVIRMNQRAARVAAFLLEPRSGDSFVRWGFMNAIFEQKEYGEDYKLEILAREMLQDSTTRREYENQIKSDPAFAGDYYARLNWFYQRSPYWDQTVNRYPIGKVMKKEDWK